MNEGNRPTTMGTRHQKRFLTEEEQIIELITIKRWDAEVVGNKFGMTTDEIMKISFEAARSLFNNGEVECNFSVDKIAELYQIPSYELNDALKFDAIRRYELYDTQDGSLSFTECCKYFHIPPTTFARIIKRSKGK